MIQGIISDLKSLTRNHYVNDSDCWYSCPKSGECCNDETDPDGCNCGADEFNARLRMIVAKLESIGKVGKVGGVDKV
jgi:hypothetical protein